nr:hypothetical protein [Candidatus Mycoplasma haematolamae]
MILTAKAQWGAALVGLGGVNAASIIAFKEPIKDLFLGQNSLDLNSNNLTDLSQSSSFRPRPREGLVTSHIPSSLSSPRLELKVEEPSIQLESLKIDAQTSQFSSEFKKEIEVQKIEKDKQSKVEEAQSKFKGQEQHLQSAIERIKDYFSKTSGSQIKALTLPQKGALLKSYEVWAEIKEIERDSQEKLSKLDRNTPNPSLGTWKTAHEVKQLLSTIHWQSSSIKFKGGWQEDNNFGFTEGWSRNPWREFFVSESQWKKVWEHREKIKEEIYDDYWKLQDDWRDKKCKQINALLDDTREVCVVEMDQKQRGVLGESNLLIELMVGKRLLEWMNHSSVKELQLPSYLS